MVKTRLALVYFCGFFSCVGVEFWWINFEEVLK